MLRLTAALALAAVVAAGCAADDETITLRVSAAASLTEVFTALAAEFEDDHPTVEVELNFGPSSVLVAQVIEGAAVDVLATADEVTMSEAVDAGVVEGPRHLATNHLVLAVEPGNPRRISGVEDLGQADLVISVCAEEVPCGRLAQRLLDLGGVTADIDSFEEDVKAVAGRVALGEADVGVVYATDVLADDRLDAVNPGEVVKTRYPVAVAGTSERAETADDWIDFLVSDDGRAVFADHGFGAP